MRSFETEQDDGPRAPQRAAGVIDESAAGECVRCYCISPALKLVESNGMMKGTREVAEKLQQRQTACDHGPSMEPEAEFPADEHLGPADCFGQLNGGPCP